eukprot:c579_g1_i1.p1 GENE.c579_g1_i1~~c579_g1_i1.p1  ORF type:complete len:143 (+),score=27.51 c579_g1_i1:487-915(+)
MFLIFFLYLSNSHLKPEDFTHETNRAMTVNSINMTLSEVADASGESSFFGLLWGSLNRVVDPQNCEIYSYVPDYDSDPVCEGKLWSFNYFFFNKSLSRILYFYCNAARLSAVEDDSDGGSLSQVEFIEFAQDSDELMDMDEI